MRAHHAIELLNNVSISDTAPESLGKLRLELETTRVFLDSAVSFDFGHLSPGEEHREFGCDLLSRGMLRLPYNTVFFSSGSDYLVAHMDPEPNDKAMGELETILKDYDVDFKSMVSQVSLNPSRLNVTRLMKDDDGIFPIMSIHILGRYPDDFDVRYWHFLREVPDRNGVAHSRISEEDAAKEACGCASTVAGLVAMLMSKSAQTIHHPPPSKLNKAREAKGKPPMKDAYEVRINLGTSEKSYLAIGGTRASPRLHWRRGHYRRLGERLIPIAPCLVNAGEAAEAVLPKDYVMPASVGWDVKRRMN